LYSSPIRVCVIDFSTLYFGRIEIFMNWNFHARVGLYRKFHDVWTFTARVTTFWKCFTIHLYGISPAVKKIRKFRCRLIWARRYKFWRQFLVKICMHVDSEMKNWWRQLGSENIDIYSLFENCKIFRIVNTYSFNILELNIRNLNKDL
jgi:hypothetical protein